MNKDVEEMMAVCKWPECTCNTPDWAFSAHNRVQFCEHLKDARALAKFAYDHSDEMKPKFRIQGITDE